jgi:molecular chaperone DnaK
MPKPGLDWKPCEIAAPEEPALAPPLTGTAADESPILGIDLGTTHSAVAVVRAGKVEIIPNQEGETLTPSVVAFTADGRILVGAPAVQQAALNPHRTVSGIKRRLGRDAAREESSYELVDHPEGPCVRIDGSFFTPAEVSALILGKLLSAAEAHLGRPARRAVLTVPASFDDAQRQSTLDAALLAGIDVQWVRENRDTGTRYLQPMRVITEPAAAVLSLGPPRALRKTAVVRMGGGSCDASILDRGDGVILVLALAGDSTLGGEDFDRVLVTWCGEEVSSRYGATARRGPADYVRLKEAAEQAKKELSQQETARVFVPYLFQTDQGALPLDLTVTRAEFERRSAGLIDHFRSLVVRVLKESMCKPTDIDEVLLVGGMMRMPRLRKVVREVFGREPSGVVHSPEAVARGAAVQGAELLLEADSNLLLMDVAPFTLGVEAADGSFVELMARNTSIPCERRMMFTTVKPNQRGVSVRVLQSVSPGGRNRLLAQLDLDGIHPEPAGTPLVEVCFYMDHNGIVWVTAKDHNSGRKKSIRLAGGRRLGPAEADELRRKAERHSARQGGMETARKRAQACLDRVEAQLRDRPADLDPAGAARMRVLAEEVRCLMDGDDPAKLNGAVAGMESAAEAMSDWVRQRRAQPRARSGINLEL